jgi:hypothetical protein
MVIKVRKAVGRPNTTATKEATSKPTEKQEQHHNQQQPLGWSQVFMPLIAGLFHLQVFYYAAFHNILPRFLPHLFTAITTTSSSTSSSELPQLTTNEFKNGCYQLDQAIFLAYIFDLLCCTLNIIPFSRCNSPKDIIGHHIPTLILALPLAMPLWHVKLEYLDPTVLLILNDDNGNITSLEIRKQCMDAFMLASGFAYISSLNEVIMCFQRVEMSLNSIRNFNDIPSSSIMKKSGRHCLFTSRFVIGFELFYKLFFFWGMSILACKACCEFDKSLYDAITSSLDYTEPMWRTFLTIYTSPAILRGALFRVFSVVMYPSMGRRCLKKIKQFLKEGGSRKSL